MAPVIFGRDDVSYITCSDEHGIIDDKQNKLKINDKLHLIPGHCDPTCSLHDWYVCVRDGHVEEFGQFPQEGKVGNNQLNFYGAKNFEAETVN